MRIRIKDLFCPGSGMEKFGSGILYKIPCPQGQPVLSALTSFDQKKSWPLARLIKMPIRVQPSVFVVCIVYINQGG